MFGACVYALNLLPAPSPHIPILPLLPFKPLLPLKPLLSVKLLPIPFQHAVSACRNTGAWHTFHKLVPLPVSLRGTRAKFTLVHREHGHAPFHVQAVGRRQTTCTRGGDRRFCELCVCV
eukprot:GDKI01011279.1.p1 GENE.GDKI01011279.1~~GDKI01011279.1.p1  ORF type:complete len:119 (-),score=11.50 GDKI01011279.1:154-510(-)